MGKLQFDHSHSDPGLIATWVAGIIAAIAGCIWAGWVAGCLGFLLVASIVLVLFETHSDLQITPEVRRAAELAREAARRKYPGEAPDRIEVRSIADDRYVFTVRYWKGWSAPPVRRYFAVIRPGLSAQEIDDPAGTSGG
jgi:hypothetical protein